MEPKNRRAATELIVAGSLTAIGIAVGGPGVLESLLGLAGAVGVNWAADLAEKSYQSWCRNWFTPATARNRDMAKALAQAFQDTAEELARIWPRQDAYARLPRETQQLTLEGLEQFKEQGLQVLTELHQDPTPLPQQMTQLLMEEKLAPVQQSLKTSLADFFHGYPQPFTDFLANHLVELWLAHFKAILKSSDETGARAWRALQLGWQASLNRTLIEMGQEITEARAVLDWLQAWAQRLESLPPTEREETGQQILEETLARVLEPIHSKLDQILEQLPPPTPPSRTVHPFTPPAPRRLYGRETILDELAQELCQTKDPARPLALTALQGLPGVGKTALALALAHHPRIKEAFPDGVLWIPLGPELVLEQLSSRLDSLITYLGGATEGLDDLEKRSAALRALLQGKRILLILDDMWRSEMARPFTQACVPPAQALITTRDAQQASDLDATLRQVTVLSPEAAVAMLAGAGDAAAQAVEQDPEGAARLAQALGHLPLALEVAGRYLARLARSDGPKQAVATLRQELAEEEQRLLELQIRRPRQGLDEEKPSLEAILGLSYRALPDDATRRAFRRLAVFGPRPASFDRPAMDAVWGAGLAEAPRTSQLNRWRTALVDAALLTREDGEEPESAIRYSLHQVLALYAQALLEADPEETRLTRLAHGRYYAGLAQAGDGLITEVDESGQSLLQGLAWLDQEQGQLFRAVAWALEQEDDQGRAVLRDLVLSLRNYALGYRNLHREYGLWLDRALEACRSLSDPGGQAYVLQAKGDVLAFLDQRDQALRHYDQAFQLFQQVGSSLGQANVLKAKGDVLAFLDQRDQALRHYDQALQLFQQVGDRLGQANVLQAKGQLLLQQGEVEEGMALLEEARQLYQAVGDRAGLANVGIVLARHAATQGEYARALQLMQPALEFVQAIGHPLAEHLQAEMDAWRAQLE